MGSERWDNLPVLRFGRTQGYRLTIPESTQGPSGRCPSKSEHMNWEVAFSGRLTGTTSWNGRRGMPPLESKKWFLITQDSTGSRESTLILPTWFFIHKTGCLFPNQSLLPPWISQLRKPRQISAFCDFVHSSFSLSIFSTGKIGD